jgi:hypothetical protein
MSAFEFWLDIRVSGEPACTIFGVLEMPVRPQVGERISFHQLKGSALEFQTEWSEVGWRRENMVAAEVDEISHYAVPSKGKTLAFKSAIRAVPLNVRTAEDARVVRDILTKQAGLEVDPYGVNTLDDQGSET